LLLLAPFSYCQNKQVRDSHGQLVATRRQHDSTTEARDAAGRSWKPGANEAGTFTCAAEMGGCCA
jgi:hypothetical protein